MISRAAANAGNWMPSRTSLSIDSGAWTGNGEVSMSPSPFRRSMTGPLRFAMTRIFPPPKRRTSTLMSG